MKLSQPVFKPVPQSHLADTIENIENFIKRGKKEQLETLCIPCNGPGSHMGYRFVRSEDLTETIQTEEKFRKVGFKMEHTVHYMALSSFFPLHFVPYKVMSIVIIPDGRELIFESKAQLKRDLNDYINSLK